MGANIGQTNRGVVENEIRSRDANKQGRRGSKKEASVYSHNDMDEDQKKLCRSENTSWVSAFFVTMFNLDPVQQRRPLPALQLTPKKPKKLPRNGGV